jgi:hypothetical protein
MHLLSGEPMHDLSGVDSPAKGAETIVYLASSPDVAETTGQYFYKSMPTTPSSWAQDDRSALLLWQRTAAMAGMKE